MRELPAAARGYIAGAALAAALCAVPAALLGAEAPWATALVLAALYGLCGQVRRCEVTGCHLPFTTGSFLPVLLTAVFLLPPPLAALVAVPGALIAPVEERSAAARKVWHAAELALATCAAAHVFRAVGHQPLSAPQFPLLLLPAAAAAGTFSAVLAVLDGGVLIAAERHPARTAWRGLLPRSLGPHLVHGLAGLMMAVLWHSSYGPLAALPVLLPMHISCWVFAQYHRERAAHRATVRALVQAVDIKDRYTRGHSERVGRASVMIGRELGLAEDRLEVLRIAGILHDVGKLGVPTRLLRKDGPLTPQERDAIELHPEYGHEIVRGIGFLGEARAAILHHHERVDGRGYPHGLSGAQIPELARVVAVADAFDAMTSTRCYRRARPVAAALAELRNCAGAQFDPRMVRALAASLERHGWHPDPVPPAEAGAGVAGDAAVRGAVVPVGAAQADAGAAPGGRGNVPPRRPEAAPESTGARPGDDTGGRGDRTGHAAAGPAGRGGRPGPAGPGRRDGRPGRARRDGAR
ncbi:HD-GYP domain-containing protein [Streptomyces celluloflavus]|uniref:HD-GYP domain-containing protein n=1 Tax=Streptomyces celluloflavus TaxID=58344 RepID=UPI00345F284D|nr:HD-GYP domain-containing protein [Streptomyces celluloflavus]